MTLRFFKEKISIKASVLAGILQTVVAQSATTESNPNSQAIQAGVICGAILLLVGCRYAARYCCRPREIQPNNGFRAMV